MRGLHTSDCMGFEIALLSRVNYDLHGCGGQNMGVPISLDAIQARRVCLIKPSSLGDVVHATPVFAALRSHWPRAHFAWVINRGLRGLVDGLTELDEVIEFDRQAARGPLAGIPFARLLWELRSRRFDVAIDLQGLLRSALMCAATGARVRVGLAGAREGARHVYTHMVEPPGGVTHAVDRMLCVADAFGASPTAPRFLISRHESDRAWAQAQLAALPRPRVAVNPGARWVTKRWPPQSFAAVACMAHEQLGAGVVVLGGSEDRALVDAFRAAAGNIPLVDLCGRTSLPQLAEVAAACDLYLTNDSGPMHVAAAVGANVVGVFTCTRPELTGPYGPSASVVRTGVWCAGSCVKTCSRLECMTELSAARVWSEVRARLIGAGRDERAA